MRPIGLLGVVAMLVVAGCGGSAVTTTTSSIVADPVRDAAVAYSVTAERALQDTLFEVDRVALVDLIVEACDDLSPADSPSDVAARALQTVAGFGTDSVEDAILISVVAEGVAASCALRVEDATLAGEAFRSVVSEGIEATGLDVGVGEALVAGRSLCAALDDGDSVAEAVDEASLVIFGVGLDDLEAGGGGANEGTLLGVVLAGSASFLCPQHLDTIQGFVAG